MNKKPNDCKYSNARRERNIFVCTRVRYEEILHVTASCELNIDIELPCLFTVITASKTLQLSWKQIICVMKKLAEEVEFHCCR